MLTSSTYRCSVDVFFTNFDQNILRNTPSINLFPEIRIPPTRFSAISPFMLRTLFFQNGPAQKKKKMYEKPHGFSKCLMLVINKSFSNQKKINKMDDSALPLFLIY
ncbi:unnamed protein product [Meganyctiphanes norvegica]|uniref:Uncharacterized protein n=1 Tax=Meganyctiphanes norvegica TaxID=48144 RepID=A0AAV2SLH1_MEGNR